MELEKVGDGDHSTEMLSALKRFEDVCNSLEDEHTKLLELEKRRQKLNEDLERLRNEIREEKDFFRSAIDEPFVEELQTSNDNSNEPLSDLMEPMTLDTGAIKEFLKTQREEIASREQEMSLQHMKEGLRQYQETYLGEQFEDIERQAQCANTHNVSEELNLDVDNNYDDIEILNTSDFQIEDFVDYVTSEEQ